jgi:VanZ family protein
MVIIFSASSDSHSAQHTSRIVEPLMHWLFPHASEQTMGAVILGFRKCAHLAEYAILALLCWLGLRPKDQSPAWSWRRAFKALLIVTLYAITDEYHQTFVPTREGSVWDVLIDMCGGSLGLMFLWVFIRWRRPRSSMDGPRGSNHQPP